MSILNLKGIILAAGRSTRFKTKRSKLLFNICGRPMIMYTIRALEGLGIPMTMILGYQFELIQSLIEREGMRSINFVTQKEQLGTGHAVKCSVDSWQGCDDILIINGDIPLITEELLRDAVEQQKKNNAVLTFLTTMVLNPTGYGRVVEFDGKYKIVEEVDCTLEQLQINKVNVGVYVINRRWLEKNISHIARALSGEYHLTDLIRIASNQGVVLKEVLVPFDDVRGINNLQELWNVEQIKRSELIKYWMSNGVRFELAQSIHIDINVKIGAGSFIGTGVHLLGDTEIGEECSVGAFSIVESSKIGNGTMIYFHSIIQNSMVGEDVCIGPFARLRQNSYIGNNVEIGNFVEIKNAQIGDYTKAKHLTYLGDAKIGKVVNIGAGTVICNYDGQNKYKTEIEDETFVGSNNTLIAPLKLGKKCYTAAGSTITNDVPAGGLAIGRSRQENKIDYVKKLLAKKRYKDSSVEDSEYYKQQENQKEDKKKEEYRTEFSFRGAVKTKTDKYDSSL